MLLAFDLSKDNDQFKVFMESVKDKEYARFDLHSVFLTKNGEVFVRGDNQWGQLGLGDNANRMASDGSVMPVQITQLPPIQNFYITLRVTFYISEQGDIYGCGDNQHGQVGLGHSEAITEPCMIQPFSDERIAFITGNHSESYFLSESGKVYFTGTFNQFAWWGNNTTTVPTQIPALNNITKIDCGTDVSLFLNESGKVYFRRNNLTTAYNGQEGMSVQELPIEGVIDVQAVNRGCLLLTESGEIFTYDFNEKTLEKRDCSNVSRMLSMHSHGEYTVFELEDGAYQVTKNKNLERGLYSERFGIDGDEPSALSSLTVGNAMLFTEDDRVMDYLRAQMERYHAKFGPIELSPSPAPRPWCSIL